MKVNRHGIRKLSKKPQKGRKSIQKKPPPNVKPVVVCPSCLKQRMKLVWLREQEAFACTVCAQAALFGWRPMAERQGIHFL